VSKTGNIRLILDNVHDAATLTATSAASGVPVENTQRNDRVRVWRSAGTGVQVIEGTLAVGAIVDNLAVLNHNLSATASVQLTLLNGGVESWDSGEQPAGEFIPAGVWRAGIDPWGATYNDKLKQPSTLLSFPITPISGYRLTIKDELNPSGAIEIGRIVLGLVFSPAFNASYDLQIKWQDAAQHEYSAGQTLRTINGGKPRRITTFSLDWLQTQDRARLIEELAQRGMIADVFVDLYPKSTGIERFNGAFLARLTEGYGDSHSFYNNHASTFSFIEV